MKISKNWKDYVLALYSTLLAVFILAPLGLVMFTGIGLRLVGTKMERLANFNTKYDLFWLKRLKKWKES